MVSRILILKVGALGDVIRTSYILPGLKNKYKKAKIYWITSMGGYELLKYNKYIDNLINIDNLESIEKLKKKSFDIFISLEDEAEIFSIFENLKVKKIIGAYKENGKMIYTDELREWFDMGLISKFGKEKADILKKENKLSHAQIFSKGLQIEIKKPYFENNLEIEKDIKKIYEKKEKRMIGLNLSAGKRWKSKALRLEEAKKLVEYLQQDKENRIFILGGKEDLDYNSNLIKKLKSCEQLEIIEPKSLTEFAAIIGIMDFLISSDTLALHLGISQNIKTISYYAPTSAVEIDTFGLGKKIISTSEDYCSYHSEVDTSSITAERIFEEFNNMLNLNIICSNSEK